MMKTWYYIYESCEGPALLALEAASQPDEQNVIYAYPEILFQLHRDDEWITGPIALPVPRRIARPAAANTAQQEENNESDDSANCSPATVVQEEQESEWEFVVTPFNDFDLEEVRS